MRTAKLELALVFHNHQPVGNLPMVFRSCFEQAYQPLLALLEKHPGIRFGMHYSGPLLEWLDAEEPAFLDRLRLLINSGRAEVMGGGLYEPILPVIPDQDKRGQLAALSEWVQGRLGSRPVGAWLAERVWEPHLPPFLADAGIAYTVLDEEHFAKAGFDTDHLDGSYVTDDAGSTLRIYPASTSLRYVIPWRSVEEVIAFLQERRMAGQRLIVFADDGEKFGAWPGTYHHCYEDGWLERFFSSLEASSDWLQTTTLASHLERNLAAGRAYLPSASYHEMEDWSLPPLASRRLAEAREAVGPERSSLMRIGHWRGFLAKYEESSMLLQRANGISRKVHAMPSGPSKQQALDHLWRAQCNCPYWHGVFGGIYMYHIRHAMYHHLIAAETLAAPLADTAAVAEQNDFDADGLPEVRLATREQSLFWHSNGACLYEWDLNPLWLNLLNTLAPYQEGYALPTKQTGSILPKPSLRRAFLDHLLSARPSLAEVQNDAWPTYVTLSGLSYQLKPSSGAAVASLRMRLDVPRPDENAALHLCKDVVIHPGRSCLQAQYELLAEGPWPGTDPWFAVEISFAPPAGSHQSGALACGQERRGLMEAWEIANASSLEFAGPSLAMRLSWRTPGVLLTHPLLSQSRGEHGPEQVYQGTRVVLAWPLPPMAVDAWREEISWEWSTLT